MKTLLVTGISGFLGWHLAVYQQSHWDIVGIYNKHKPNLKGISLIQCDLNDDFSKIEAIILSIKPSAVLHLAAWANPNACEAHPLASKMINVDLTAKLAECCDSHNIYFLLSSTDLVFDGENAPYSETSKANPINVYGQQKAEAEALILRLAAHTAIARLPLMYGFAKPINSFMKAWIKSVSNKQKVYAFIDEYRTMVSGKSAASGLFLLLEHQVTGIWHLGGKERISRYQFAQMLADTFRLPSANFIPSEQKDMLVHNTFAKRPADVSLSSLKAFALGYHPLSLKEALMEIYNH